MATAAWYSSWYTFLRTRSTSPHTKVPPIWICTGVHLISDAKVHSDSTASSGQSAGATLDAGLIAGGIPTGQTIAKVDVSHESTNRADTEFRVSDYRVWAAKWFALDIKYVRPEEKLPVGAEQYVIKLGEVEDLGSGGIREDSREISSPTDDDGRRVAVLEGLAHLDESRVVDGDTSEGEFSERAYSEALEGVDDEAFENYRLYVDCLG
jgi:hypothetical protein